MDFKEETNSLSKNSNKAVPVRSRTSAIPAESVGDSREYHASAGREKTTSPSP
jgi:hypothetical protein